MKFVRVLVQSYWIPGFLPESGRNRWRSVKSSLLATLSLGDNLLLSTMLGTVFRVHSMLPNMEINEK
jgi:hypothetical protein